MLNSRTRIFVSVLTLIIYGTLALVSVPLHFHQHVLLSSGTGDHAFAHHSDASHCEHHAIESHDHCTLCSITSQVYCSSVAAVGPVTDPVIREQSDALWYIPQLQFTSVLSRRGPPSILS